MGNRWIVVVAVGGLLCMSGLVQGELIVNGGFETQTNYVPGTWTEKDGNGAFPVPWGNGGPPDFNEPYCSVMTGHAHSGTYAFGFGYDGSTPSETIYQDLATISGKTYNVSFWLMGNNLTGVTNEFVLTFDGQEVLHLNNVNSFDYTQYTVPITVSGSGSIGGPISRLEIGGRVVGGDAWYVDDVSVTEAVPEPATLGLLALGGMALLRSRRRKQS